MCWQTESPGSRRPISIRLRKALAPRLTNQLEVSKAGLAVDVRLCLPCLATGPDASAEVNRSAWASPAPPTGRRMRAQAERHTSVRKEGAHPWGGR